MYRLGLIGLAAAAIVAVAVIALTAPAGAMSMGNRWLPTGLRVFAVVVYIAVVIVHVWHLRASAMTERAWHATHVLMALGMIAMFAPNGQAVVSARLGKAVFTVATAATLAYMAAVVLRGRRLGWLWPVAAADLAAMVYMFALPVPGFGWLTAVLIGWSVLQALGWLTGVLPARADLGSQPQSSRRETSVRVTLAAMNLGMAYMFLAMTLGMSPTPATPMTPISPMRAAPMTPVAHPKPTLSRPQTAHKSTISRMWLPRHVVSFDPRDQRVPSTGHP